MKQLQGIKIVNPINYTGWNNQILELAGYSIFHSSQWAQVLSDAYGYIPYYFIIEDEGKLSSVLPMMVINSYLTGTRAVSLPFSDYCKPLIQEEININSLVDEIIKFGQNENLKFIEFKYEQDMSNISFQSVFQYQHKLNLINSEEAIFASFRKGTKSRIKKAVREGITIQIDNSYDSVKKFCQMNDVTRKKHGLPPQPASYFDKLYKFIINKDSGFVVLAQKEGQMAAGAIYLKFGKKVLYKYSASYPEHKHLMANNLVMWEAIKYSIQNNYEEMDFGITESANEGLRVYKSGWGVEQTKINLYKYNVKTGCYVPVDTKVTGLHNQIFNRAPMPLLRIFSSVFYRHFG